MSETKFFTMGQIHEHNLPGLRKINKDTVVKIINTDPEKSCRDIAFELFGEKWAMEYNEKPDMDFYPKGIVRVDYTMWKKNHSEEIVNKRRFYDKSINRW